MEIKCNYTKVPNEIILGKLPISALRVILYLLTYQNNKKIYPKAITIAECCGISLASVHRAFRYLKNVKFITVISGKKERKPNNYIINFQQIDGLCIFTEEEKELRDIKNCKDVYLKKEKEHMEKMAKKKAEKEKELNYEK